MDVCCCCLFSGMWILNYKNRIEQFNCDERNNAKKQLLVNKNSIEKNYLNLKIDNPDWINEKQKIYNLLHKKHIEIFANEKTGNFIKIIFNKKVENEEIILLFCIEKLKMKQPLYISFHNVNNSWIHIVSENKIIEAIPIEAEQNSSEILVCEEINR